MSTEIARNEGHNLTDRMQYAKALASASLLPRAYQQNPGNVLLAMELGDALGIRPIQAINSVHVIEGKPSASADLIASLIRKAGHRLRVQGDDQSATAQIIRADDPDYTFEVTWTMDRAKAAGLTGKGVWKSYPAAMLKARAITEVARAGASDALYGVIYTPEELGAEVTASGDPAQRGPVATAAPVEYVAEPVATVTMSRKRPTTEPVDAEVVVEQTSAEDQSTDTPAPEAAMSAPGAGGITKAQSRMLHALLNKHGMSDRDQYLAFLSREVGRTLTTSDELTKAEASKIIDSEHGAAPEPTFDEAS